MQTDPVTIRWPSDKGAAEPENPMVGNNMVRSRAASTHTHTYRLGRISGRVIFGNDDAHQPSVCLPSGKLVSVMCGSGALRRMASRCIRALGHLGSCAVPFGAGARSKISDARAIF